MRITNRHIYALLSDMACELEVLREEINALKPKEAEPKKGRGRPKGSKNKTK